MKSFKDVFPYILLVVIYSVNLCFALSWRGPYWNMWVTITTTGIGAGLPVWLVWHLTEQSRELKEKEKF